MKKLVTRFLIAALASTLTANVALADHGYYRNDYGRHHHHHHSHRDRGDWVGPAALLAITGLAIGAVAYNQSASAPVYVAPPRTVPPPESGSWYYCYSSGQYYPYVRYCPEGWQAVMPAR